MIHRYRCGQWVFDLKVEDGTEDVVDHGEVGGYRIFNPGPDGECRFFLQKDGPFGTPITVAESALALNLPQGFAYVDGAGASVVPSERISGIICKGRPDLRFSLSNWVLFKKRTVEVGEGGAILIDGEVWWLHTLFMKDKNRIQNYDALLVQEPPTGPVRVIELGDLADLIC